jgi:hypothetical protein
MSRFSGFLLGSSSYLSSVIVHIGLSYMPQYPPRLSESTARYHRTHTANKLILITVAQPHPRTSMNSNRLRLSLRAPDISISCRVAFVMSPDHHLCRVMPLIRPNCQLKISSAASFEHARLYDCVGTRRGCRGAQRDMRIFFSISGPW